MDWFDAFDEVYSRVEQFVAENGHAPREVSVSSTLYLWLAELQKESALLVGVPVADPLVLDTTYGGIPIAIDEKLGPYEIIVE